MTPEQILRMRFPDARERLKHVKKAFINDIDLDAICALASRKNNGKSCRLIGQDNSSFNACFFVEFDADTEAQDLEVNTTTSSSCASSDPISNTTAKWVIRIPIEPAIHNPWDKVRSEVATLQYLKDHTSIPVPSVFAYGCNEKLGKTTQIDYMFIITSFISGKPLSIATFLSSSEETRAAFYSQLIDILGELYQLEFPTICSLMPENQYIGPLSPALNEQRQTLPIFTLASEYMKAHWANITRNSEIVDEDLKEEDIRNEIFLLSILKPYFHELSPTISCETSPFVLYHPDFRCHNTMVDENMRIQCVIDWEFASTIPRSLLAVPSWITNHDGHTYLAFGIDKLYRQFVKVLEEKSKSSSICAQLQEEWFGKVTNPRSNAFRISYLIRWPGEKAHTFTNFFRTELFGDYEKTHAKEVEFFEQNPHLAIEARQRSERIDEYTKYLKNNGLYEEDENAVILKKLQDDMDAKTKAAGWNRIIVQ